ncbi:MAG: arginine repressor, partial [Oscillospiraceae bacterium]
MKLQRQSKILQLIEQYDIETQMELTEQLNQCGFETTQATVSRDIKELRLI